MLTINFILFLILFKFSYEDAIFTTKSSHIFKLNQKLKNPQFSGVENIYACGKIRHCQALLEFSLAENYSSNCNDHFLPVEFLIYDINQSTSSFYGYLSPKSPKIQDIQKTSDICHKIKRFF